MMAIMQGPNQSHVHMTVGEFACFSISLTPTVRLSSPLRHEPAALHAPLLRIQHWLQRSAALVELAALECGAKNGPPFAMH
jgi:hypothetical protein